MRGRGGGKVWFEEKGLKMGHWVARVLVGFIRSEIFGGFKMAVKLGLHTGFV